MTTSTKLNHEKVELTDDDVLQVSTSRPMDEEGDTAGADALPFIQYWYQFKGIKALPRDERKSSIWLFMCIHSLMKAAFGQLHVEDEHIVAYDRYRYPEERTDERTGIMLVERVLCGEECREETNERFQRLMDRYKCDFGIIITWDVAVLYRRGHAKIGTPGKTREIIREIKQVSLTGTHIDEGTTYLHRYVWQFRSAEPENVREETQDKK